MASFGEDSRVRVTEGRGSSIRLSDGRWIIDATSQHNSAILGHGHPELIAAVQDAAAGPTIGEGAGWSDRGSAADDLIRTAFAGEDWARGVYFCTTGSEANDLALGLARMLTGREPIACRLGAYHGALGLGLAVSTDPLFSGGLAGTGEGFRPTIPLGVPVRTFAAQPDSGVDEALRGAAAVITDIGSGHVFADGASQDALASSAAAHGALWIADEVWTAPGRLGSWLSFQAGEARPDMVTLGKGLTGGAAPGAALVLSERIVSELRGWRWMTSSTFRGHPLAIAAMRATLAVVERDDLVNRASMTGKCLGDGLRRLMDSHPGIESVEGRGLLWGVRLRPTSQWSRSWRGDGTAIPPARQVASAALDMGAMVAPHGALGITVAPPLIISDGEVARLVDALDGALAQVGL